MERSLSVLLPVYNLQSRLTAMVQEILDVLPELTRRFEVVIIDDGSTDATIEVADELATYYPQVSVFRHAVHLGRAAAIRTGLDRSTGEIILLQDADGRLPIDQVHKLWRRLDDDEHLPWRPWWRPQSNPATPQRLDPGRGADLPPPGDRADDRLPNGRPGRKPWDRAQAAQLPGQAQGLCPGRIGPSGSRRPARTRGVPGPCFGPATSGL